MDDLQDEKLRSEVAEAMRTAVPKASPSHDASILAAAANIAQQRAQPNRRWRAPVFAVAATILISVSLLQTRLFHDDSNVNIQRSGDQAATLPMDGSTLEQAPTEFQWVAAPGASAYRITVYDDAALKVWQSEWTSIEQFAPDAPQLTLMQPGSRYFWTVEAKSATATQSLGPFWFSIE